MKNAMNSSIALMLLLLMTFVVPNHSYASVVPGKGETAQVKNENQKASKKKFRLFAKKQHKKAAEAPKKTNAKNQIVALLLCFFLGYLGIHRFYLGYVGLGILYIFTLGLFGIGVIVDFILLLFKGFNPKNDSWEE